MKAWRSLEWLGSTLQMAGATIVASNAIHPYWGYCTMLPGSIIWLGLAWRDRSWAAAAMWSTFCAINCLGVGRWAA